MYWRRFPKLEQVNAANSFWFIYYSCLAAVYIIQSVQCMTEKEQIRAAVRIRPFLQHESINDRSCLSAQSNIVTLSSGYNINHFALPAFSPNASQQQIFNALVAPLAQDMLKGYSCAFLAYGQNGSGKSYTVEGKENADEKGMVSRLAEHIGAKLQNMQNQSDKYLLRVSYVQIWEEQIIDLLEVRRRKQANIVERGREVELVGLQLKHIRELQDIESYFILGNRKRRYAYKKGHRAAQKSTAIFSLYFQSCDRLSQVRKGKLHIVDMSASQIIPYKYIQQTSSKAELQKESLSSLRKEAAYDISLHALKNVLLALAFGTKQSFVPYSDSKVTLFLREFFGGNSRATILFHLYPGEKGYVASLESLRLASHLSLIQNYPLSQLQPSNVTITRLLQEISQTKQQLKQVLEKLSSASRRRQQMGEGLEERENQFLTRSFIIRQDCEQIDLQLDSLKKEKEKLRKRVESLSGLFLRVRIKEADNLSSGKKYAGLLQIQRGQLEEGRRRLIGDSIEGLEVSEFKQVKGRAHKQEIFQLQREFQAEREMLLGKIRGLERQFKFYQTISQQTVRKQEINLLKSTSRYDQTTRSYQVPKFSILNKKFSLAQRFYSPNLKAITQRTFYLGRSCDKFRGATSQESKHSLAVKQIKYGAELREEYCEKGWNAKRKKKQVNDGELQELDEYEIKDQGRRHLCKRQISLKNTRKPFSNLRSK